MSANPWQTVIERLSLPDPLRKRFQQGELCRSELSLSEKVWRITLQTPCLVMPEEENELVNRLLTCFPGLTGINLHFVFRLPGDENERLRQYWPRLLAKTAQVIPAARGFLEPCEISWQNGKVLLALQSPFAIQWLKRRGCLTIMSRLINEELQMEVPIHTVISSELQGKAQTFLAREKEREIALIRSALTPAEKPASETNGKVVPASAGNTDIFLGKRIDGTARAISELVEEEDTVILTGRIMSKDVRPLKTGRNLITFSLTDETDSINVKCFRDGQEPLPDEFKEGSYVKVRGKLQYDKFDQELSLLAFDINFVPQPPGREDKAAEKRVELHFHTQMSTMDALVDIEEGVKLAARFGHQALAITDHGVVQAFPMAYKAGKEHGVKIIFGVEGYVFNDDPPIVRNPRAESLDDLTFVALDFETTGLTPHSHHIIEVGAVKFTGGREQAAFATFVKPLAPIPPEITKLTGISQEMVENAPPIEEVLPKLLEFIGDHCVVAHNAPFDLGFLETKAGRQLQNPVIDTLTLSRAVLPHLKSHRLNIVAKEVAVSLENHHRAVDDARACGKIFTVLSDKLTGRGIKNLVEINQLAPTPSPDQIKTYHILILVENEIGLKNLYRLISLSHLQYYHRRPRIPKSELSRLREGLLLGTACEAGELYRAILRGAPEAELLSIARFYDFLEIQPLGNNEFLLRSGEVDSLEKLMEFNRRILALGKKLNKPVVATGDVHFLHPQDEIFRRILLAGQGFEDADHQAPLYYRTTEEMLKEFAYLGEQNAYDVVIKNPNLIAERIQAVKPLPDGLHPPEIPGAEEEIERMSYTRAREWYGDPLPKIVEARLEKELTAIIKNGYAVLYLIAQKLVKKSNDDGYLVGSRGSVGSSLVATMCGITEVNPLPPHYRCLKCKHSEFVTDGSVGCGIDMPDKICPRCGAKMIKDGFDIPFETFMGFDGDKIPDIDLNFSGEYQPVAHKYVEELFGQGYVFRAGTIATIADKTAYGFVKNYLAEKKIIKREAEINRLVRGLTGVKRTTGQHPGGIMVVPRSCDIHDFTPIQHPADDSSSEIITTHFDYHSIHDNIVKLDILGHDDPTAIRMLEELTGINARSIPLDDPDTMAIFSGLGPLGVTEEEIGSRVGTYGVPEFGTRFVRQMLEDTNPKTFSDLVRISGLSHGTNVWLNNAQELVRSGVATLAEVIPTRDDIMVYLLYKGLPPKRAFQIMESVRKGKGLKPVDEEEMRAHNVPDWYINSCKKIKYMFPKAHAAAYVMMSYRVAYFKVHYPLAYYVTYYTVRGDDFDADIICRGPDYIRRLLAEIDQKGNEASQKEKNLVPILEVALEMYCRGIGMKRVDLHRSHATRFLIDGNTLIPPLSSLQGVGAAAAQSIAAARDEAPYISVEDLRVRGKASKTVIEALKAHGALGDLPEQNQISLFDAV